MFGTILALIPLTTLLLSISVIMAGQLWDVDLTYACELLPGSDADSGCGRVIFDLFKNQLKYTDSDFDSLRNARCGLTFIICGVYLMIYLSDLFVPIEEIRKLEAYNGNIWN